MSTADEISDGFHTFGELYDHRRALTLALARALPGRSWRADEHHPDDDPIFAGYFIVGIDVPGQGVITYHYSLSHWHEFDGMPTLHHAPKWDGAGPGDTVERLLAYGRA